MNTLNTSNTCNKRNALNANDARNSNNASKRSDISIRKGKLFGPWEENKNRDRKERNFDRKKNMMI